VHEFILHYFAAEGRLWRTLNALVLHPGRLTLEYLRGRKLAYVNPLRLYLTLSVLFFLALRLVIAPAGERLNTAIHRSLTDGHSSVTILGLGFGEATRKPDGTLVCTLPAWLCKRVQERLLNRPGELERRISSLPTELLSHFSTAVFLLLPVFAFFLQLAYVRRTYGEHFLFALHVDSFWFLVLLVLLLPWPWWIQIVLQVYMVFYTLFALHRVYASPWWQTVLKGLAVGAAYGAALSVATLLIAVWTLVA
jgi:hypothetical protein